MSLAAGQTLSFYEVLGPLGRGGMGEVWRARDTRLEREVAIKVLPAEFVEDEERLRRFEREAKVLASLNHPNVSAIHGIDQVGETCFLVLELVPGENLAQRLARGPLPVDEAIDVCRQIAEGLEAAHEAGVVHRDLKPANVHVTPEGVVKVLDFGLAKPRRDGAESGSTTAEPDSFLATAEGLVLGTPTYMSPEQARGRAVDRRSDVWSFGCVLYECLTSRRAFGGDTVPDVIAEVLGSEPDLQALPSATPSHVRHLLGRCLTKDPRRRLRDMGEARLLLEEGPGVLPAPSATAEGEPQARRLWTPWLLLAVAVVASVWAWGRGAPPPASAPPPVTRFVVDLVDEGERTIDDELIGVALAPDGRSVAVSVLRADDARSGVYVRRFETLEAQHLPWTAGARDVVFSPDGRWILYHDSFEDELRRVSPEGGRPATIAPVRDPTGLTVNEEGAIVHPEGWGHGLLRHDPEGGRVEALTELDAERGDRNHLEPFFLPAGRGLVFAIWTGESWDRARIAALDLESRAVRVVQEGGTTPRFLNLPDGSGALLWARAGALWARRFDPERLEGSGDAVQVLDGVKLFIGSGTAFYDVSPSGTLAYFPGGPTLNQERMLWVDAEGGEEEILPDGPYQTLSLSRDGRRLVFVREGPVFHVHAVDLSRPPGERIPRRLTFQDDSYNCVLSPDGERLAYIANPEGDYRLYVQDFEGGAEPIELWASDHTPRSWSSDGRWLAVVRRDQGTGSDVVIVRTDGARDEDGAPEVRDLVVTPGQEWDPQISPDDRWLAFNSSETGRREVYVVSFPEGTGRYQVTSVGAYAPRWSPDGKQLYYSTGDSRCFAVEVRDGDVLSFGPPRLLFEGTFRDAEGQGGFEPAPDGRFAVLEPLLPDEEGLRVVVIEGFVRELMEKLPPLGDR